MPTPSTPQEKPTQGAPTEARPPLDEAETRTLPVDGMNTGGEVLVTVRRQWNDWRKARFRRWMRDNYVSERNTDEQRPERAQT